jgi:large subunit ribosomal protein L21
MNMTFAVIETGGKQYKVSAGQKIRVEKLAVEEGAEFVFDKVLLVVDEKKIELGKPYLESKKVEAKVLDQGKAKKVIVFKYKNKTRQMKRKGHRQPYTELEIVGIK